MQEKKLLFGLLRSAGYLKTESEDILLSKISMQAAQSPESAALEISPEEVGKMALVKGKLSNHVLYSAHIMEIVPHFTGTLMKSLIKKGTITSEELQNQLTELTSEDIENQDKKMLCALVIGHKRMSPGAVNVKSNLSEFDFNEDLSLRIENKVQKTLVQRVYRRTYKELPNDINSLGPNFVVSLHCNAFNKKVSGTEVLYYHKSDKGEKMAEILLDYLVENLKLPNRGIRPKTSEDRGGYILRYTNAPCVIVEPFFIDNDKDLKKAQESIEGLAETYAKAIDKISEEVL